MLYAISFDRSKEMAKEKIAAANPPPPTPSPPVAAVPPTKPLIVNKKKHLSEVLNNYVCVFFIYAAISTW